MSTMTKEHKKSITRSNLRTAMQTLRSDAEPSAKRQASSLIYKTLYPTLMAYVTRKLGNTSSQNSIEDVVMVTFEKLFAKVDSYKGEHEVSTWAFTIASNTLIDLRRRERDKDVVSIDFLNAKSEEEFGNDAVFKEMIASTPDPLEQAMALERKALVRKALSKLPTEKERIALTLRFFDELSYEEIVEVMHLPMGSVKSLINRAKYNIAHIMGPQQALRA